jgi:valyl-tRNA synthetase
VGTSGQDQRYDQERVASYQRFANKIWNVTRLLVTRLGDGDRIDAVAAAEPGSLLPEDRWIRGRLAEAVQAVDRAIEQYRFHDAMERLYAVIWQDFCSDYMEIVKVRLRDGDPTRPAAAATAVGTLDALLRLLHPLMPFVTEECAQRLPAAAPSLMHRGWPVAEPPSSPPADAPVRDGVDEVLALVRAIRSRRQAAGIGIGDARSRLVLRGGSPSLTPDDRRRVLEALAPVRVAAAGSTGAPDGGVEVVVAGSLEADLILGAQGGEARIRRQLADVEAQLVRVRQQLASPEFCERAPGAVVEAARSRLTDLETEAEALRRRLGPAA